MQKVKPNKIHLLGARAKLAGHGKTANPFQITGSPYWKDWRDGWEHGDQIASGAIHAASKELEEGAGQSKLWSMGEAIVSTAIGLVVSYFFQLFLNYVYNIPMTNLTAFWIVFWFTVLSFVRTYAVRRIFNRYDK